MPLFDALLSDQGFIEAIKEYRVRFNVSLVEAKVAVDMYRDSIHPNQIA